jgi:ABC-2 type transport system permease protein
LGAGVMGARVRWAWLPLTVGVVAVSTACWFYLFSILAIRLRRMDSFNTFTSAAYILLMFFSSMFYPLDDLPGWFRVLSRFNPMTWHVDSLRLCVLGMGNVQMVAIEFLAFTGFTALCLALAARALNRAD